MARNSILFLLSLWCHLFAVAQSGQVPAWFMDELAYQLGTWTTSNAAYSGDREPMTDYIVEWSWGEHRNALVGKLYGSINGKPTRPFWEFYQYWDPARQQAVFQQIGQDGTLGIGSIRQENSGSTVIEQQFTHPGGSAFQMGHRHIILDKNSYQGDSYRIDSTGQWLPDRQYRWIRVPPAPDSASCRCCQAPHTDFDFWTGEWLVADSTGTFLGTNRIERHLDQCLLLENWTSGGQNRGKSMNYVDPADQLWHQVWVDNQGTVLHLTGGLQAGSMVLESDWQEGTEATRYRHRITWKPRPNGQVIQTWEMLGPNGKVLQTLFTGIYTRWPRVGEP